MVNPGQFRLDILRVGDIAVLKPREVELHAGLETPVERHLVDGDRALAFVHRRCEVIRRVEMCTVMGNELDALDRPGLLVGQIFGLQAGEETREFGHRHFMVDIVDFRPEHGRIRDDVVLQIDRQIDDAACHG
jgi:hypothetical protein